MKRVLAVLVLLGLCATTFVGCQAQTTKDYVIRYTTLQSPTMVIQQEIEKAMAEVTEKTGGHVTFQIMYGSESGFDQKEYVDVLERGLVDMALIGLSGTSFEYPWLAVTNLPYVAPNLEVREELSKTLEPMFEEFLEENSIVPLAYPVHTDAYITFYVNKEIKSAADFEGLLLRTAGPNEATAVEMLKGTPVYMAKSEIYMAMQKGTIDGAVIGPSAIRTDSLYEVCDYMVRSWPNWLPNFLAISGRFWDTLPAEYQQIMTDTFAAFDERYWDEVANNPAIVDADFNFATENGVTVTDMPADFDTTALRDARMATFLEEAGPLGEEAWLLMKAKLTELGY